jgi:dipeptidyl aminopeptidase/acylaminoacyl peptidase
VRADGTELTPLTDGTHDDRQPNWSPSGERILFQRRSLPNGDWDIHTISPDGSNLYNVTSSPSSDTDASWSPDGSWIVYSSDYGGLPAPNIYAIHASGGVPARVTSNATHEDGAPSWSPDGQWIAFESHAGQDEDSPAALWRIADVRTLPELDALTDEFANRFGAAAGSESGRERLANVTNWLYLIGDNPEPDVVTQSAASEYDLVVLDFVPSQADATDYPMTEVVAALHDAGKLVIAYIDVGQAENYRTYWQPGWRVGNPEWIIGIDPDGWEGNFPVAF